MTLLDDNSLLGKTCLNNEDEPYMNILTRTSGRPKFFWYNRRSVISQTYPKIRHYVCYDDESTYESYLKHYEKQQNLFILPVDRAKNFKSDRFPPNLYCNKLTEMVPDGWIMYLDDDDILLRDDSIERIMSNLANENNLKLWKVKFPNERIIPRKFGKKPILGDISAIGFAFHKSQWNSDKVRVNLWDDRKGSDYRVVAKLYSRLQPIWIDDVLTGVNYVRPRLIGTGQRLDFDNNDMTVKDLEEYEAWAFAHLKINHDYSHIQNDYMPEHFEDSKSPLINQGNPKKVTLKIVKKDQPSNHVQTSFPVMGKDRLPLRVSIKPNQSPKQHAEQYQAHQQAQNDYNENNRDNEQQPQKSINDDNGARLNTGDANDYEDLEKNHDAQESEEEGEQDGEQENVTYRDEDQGEEQGEEQDEQGEQDEENEQGEQSEQDEENGQGEQDEENEQGEQGEKDEETEQGEQGEQDEEERQNTRERAEQDDRDGLYQGDPEQESEQDDYTNNEEEIDDIVDEAMEQSKSQEQQDADYNHDNDNQDDEEKGLDEPEFQLHPQITKLLDLLSEDGRLFVLKEEDLKSVFIKLLKMQTLAIEQQDEIKKQLENIKAENAKLKEILSSTTSLTQSTSQGSSLSGNGNAGVKNVNLNTGMRGSTATDLLKKIDRSNIPSVTNNNASNNNKEIAAVTNFGNEHSKKSTTSSLKDDKRKRITPAPIKPTSDIANRIHNGKLSLRKTPVTSQQTRGKCSSDNSCNITASKGGGGGFNQAYASTENVSRDKKTPTSLNYNSNAKAGVKEAGKTTGKTITDDKVGSRAKTLLKTNKGRNAEDELERLLSSYAEEPVSSNYQSEDYDEQLTMPGLSNTNQVLSMNGKELDVNTVIEFFDAIFVLNLSNKADALYKKLDELGFQNIEVVPTKPNLTLIDSLAEIVLKAKNKGLKTIMVLKDNVLVHQNIMQELAYQLSHMDDKARVLYLGAALMRTKDTSFDPEFYLQTYSDLVEQGIDDEEKAQKHWKTRGHREGRWGSRNMNHPDLVKDLSAVVLHTDIFDILIKNLSALKKGAGGVKAFEKLVANYCYVVTPPPFMNELTKYNKSKNQSNAFLYF
jgi:hypothetical protein